MTKIGFINFNKDILDAIQDEKLVVFAGAGVSMGTPANLPSFEKLAREIATEIFDVPSDQFDVFLGKLEYKSIPVHARAKKIFENSESNPTPLHESIIKLFRTHQNIRIVTTNFDLLFENAAEKVYGHRPEVYDAPALPVGYDFNGIVHVHGSINKEQNMVLTDADFGRAYLTEGWARRFLINVFANYTVLFIGYSYNDVVMKYLSRALPVSRESKKYILIDKSDNWEILGIEPLLYRLSENECDDKYLELNDSMYQLADRVCRGMLDWRTRISEIASGAPPSDELLIDEFEQNFNELSIVRFFTDIARHADWPQWLNDRNYLDRLFVDQTLSEQDTLLSEWLSKNYVHDNPEVLFKIFAMHRLPINSRFWSFLVREISKSDRMFDKTIFRRWVQFLLENKSDENNHHELHWLVEKSEVQKDFDLVQHIFIFMCGFDVHFVQDFDWVNIGNKKITISFSNRADHWTLSDIWNKYILPKIHLISSRLIIRLSTIIEDNTIKSILWSENSHHFDSFSFRRPAIEPHEQNQFPEPIDVLIDAIRDIIDNLSVNSVDTLVAWINIYSKSESPLLRRLSIYAMTKLSAKSADEKILWLIDNFSLFDYHEHHEIFQLLKLVYPETSNTKREQLLNIIHNYSSSADVDNKQEYDEYQQYRLLSWLKTSDSNCKLLIPKLSKTQEKHPNWEASDHLDFNFYSFPSKTYAPESPWPNEYLLSEDPEKYLDELISYKDKEHSHISRFGLLSSMTQLSQENPKWSIKISNLLIARNLWDTDIWDAILNSWSQKDMLTENSSDIIQILSKKELYYKHAHAVANVLDSVFVNNKDINEEKLIDKLIDISITLWHEVAETNDNENNIDWLTISINRAAGVLCKFWVHSMSAHLKSTNNTSKTMPDKFKTIFLMVINEPSLKGLIGRCVLCSYLNILFEVDSGWTLKLIIPLLSNTNKDEFNWAWGGFLYTGNIHYSLAEELTSAFDSAMKRLSSDFVGNKRRFIEVYTYLTIFHVSKEEIYHAKNIIMNGSEEDKENFAMFVGFHLRQMKKEAKDQLWNSWLRGYIYDRTQSIPTPLDKIEIEKMIEWSLFLDDHYPSMVDYIVRFKPVCLDKDHFLYALRNSQLIKQFPDDTARLLMYLSKCKLKYNKQELEEIGKELKVNDEKLKYQLVEELAKIGIVI